MSINYIQEELHLGVVSNNINCKMKRKVLLLYCSEELAEVAVLHGGCSDDLGCLVLDVPGVA